MGCLVIMIHPSQLLRTNSERSHFTARNNVNSILKQNDCGITSLPCLARCCRLEKFYKITVFVTLLTLLAVVHAGSTTYFNGTTKVWRQNYKVSERISEWILNSSSVLGGVFALFLAHYGNLIHRPSYIGALAMFQAVAGWLLIVPELHHPHFNYLNSTAVADQQQLCRRTISLAIDGEFDDGKQYIALSLIILYQLVHGLAFVSLITHGLSYIDDGSTRLAVDVFICTVIGGYQTGKFIGSNLTLIPVTFDRHIFFSFAWLGLMTMIFILGFLISLFCRYPKKMMIGYGVDALLNSRDSTVQNEIVGFWSSLLSLVSSKLQMINVLSAAMMHIAIVNFTAMREEFFRSRFINFNDELDYRFSYFQMSQMFFLCLIVTVLAIIISKRKPTPKCFIIYVISCYAVIIVLFASFAFIKCENKLNMYYKNFIRSCNWHCGCSMGHFSPVCLNDQTYYSACFAGCSTRLTTQSYIHCGCASSETQMASDGSCNREKCNMVSFIAEANTILAMVFKVTAFIVHIIIALRTVKERNHKALSLGLLLSFVMFLPFFPFRIFYQLIKDSMCARWDHNECILFKEHFPTAICSFTVALMALAMLLACGMLPLTKTIKSFRRQKSVRRNRQEPNDNEDNRNTVRHSTIHEIHEDDESDADEDDVVLEDLPRNATNLSDEHLNSSTRFSTSEGYSDADIDVELHRTQTPHSTPNLARTSLETKL